MKGLKTLTQLTNFIGQVINVGDKVVYVGWTWYVRKGTFLGLSPSGWVRISLDGGKEAYQNKWNGKIYDPYDHNIWSIYPGALYIRQSDGALVTYEDWSDLDYAERYGQNFREEKFKRHPGVLRTDFIKINVPNIFLGPKGLERTFKVEGE